MNHKFTEAHADGGLVRKCEGSWDSDEIKTKAQKFGYEDLEETDLLFMPPPPQGHVHKRNVKDYRHTGH